jgi:hypothetical protein
MSPRKFKMKHLNLFKISKHRKSQAPPPVDVSNPEFVSALSQQILSYPAQAAYHTELPKDLSPLQIGKDVLKEVLETVKDGSDLFLPLKAVLVGVVKIMDVVDVRENPPNSDSY